MSDKMAGDQRDESQRRVARRMMSQPKGCTTNAFLKIHKMRAEYRRAISSVRKDLVREGATHYVDVKKLTIKNYRYHIRPKEAAPVVAAPCNTISPEAKKSLDTGGIVRQNAKSQLSMF